MDSRSSDSRPASADSTRRAARVAYLEATAAAAWVESHAGGAGIGALLDAIAAGQNVDVALRRCCAIDTAGLDATLRREIQAEFATP